MGEAKAEGLVLRDRVLRSIRGFFHRRGFVEVETPQLVRAPGQEPHLDALEVTCRAPSGEPFRRFLHTSPEYAMKRLLARGMRRIFQVCKAFRDGEGGPNHQVEFTLLEWYRAGADYRSLIADCQGLLREVTRKCGVDGRLRRQGVELDLSIPFEEVTVREAFRRYAGLELPREPELHLFQQAAAAAGLEEEVAGARDAEEAYFRLFLARVEPRLGRRRPLFLIDFPAWLAALARTRPDDPRVAERFELYAGGVELANAFSELTDAGEQRRRFLEEQRQRREMGKPVYPLDEDFLRDLARMPPAAGIALGVDRLVMLVAGAAAIGEVLAFPEASASAARMPN